MPHALSESASVAVEPLSGSMMPLAPGPSPRKTERCGLTSVTEAVYVDMTLQSAHPLSLPLFVRLINTLVLSFWRGIVFTLARITLCVQCFPPWQTAGGWGTWRHVILLSKPSTVMVPLVLPVYQVTIGRLWRRLCQSPHTVDFDQTEIFLGQLAPLRTCLDLRLPVPLWAAIPVDVLTLYLHGTGKDNSSSLPVTLYLAVGKRLLEWQAVCRNFIVSLCLGLTTTEDKPRLCPAATS